MNFLGTKALKLMRPQRRTLDRLLMLKSALKPQLCHKQYSDEVKKAMEVTE